MQHDAVVFQYRYEVVFFWDGWNTDDEAGVVIPVEVLLNVFQPIVYILQGDGHVY